MIATAASECPSISAFTWDKVEPQYCDSGEAPIRCYSRRLKADLLPGTFVLLLSTNSAATTIDESRNNFEDAIVARVINVEELVIPFSERTSSAVQVNIFQRLTELTGTGGEFMHPSPLDDNHLRHIPEVVQTPEIRSISSDDIINLAFVFTMESLQDSCNLFSTCQGMANAFVVRFRLSHGMENTPILLTDLPNGCCLPFPPFYPLSWYHDCFPSQMWRSVICVKLEVTKLLGRYSHQQGLFGKEVCCLTNFTSEAWGFLHLQFNGRFLSGVSTRMRRHRVSESGLVVRAVRVNKPSTILRFESKAHLQVLCNVFGESTTAGQRCRLPKISAPKSLWQNDIINVVCCSDVCESLFDAKTVRDGIDLEFDGGSELFITIRYRRFAFTTNSLREGDCDELLSSLIRRCNPYNHDHSAELMDVEDTTHMTSIVSGSEFEDHNGCLYRVVSMNSTQVSAVCCYPRSNNVFYGTRKSFDIDSAKELIQMRLN